MTTISLDEATALVQSILGATEVTTEVAEDAEVLATLDRYRELRAARDTITDALAAINTTLLSEIDKRGGDTLTIAGKAVARRQTPTTTRIDSKRLREELPAVWEKFSTTTSTVRLTVSKG